VANHPQAKKRNRQIMKRTARNRHIRATLRGTVKRVRVSIQSGNKSEAEGALKIAVRNLDRAVTKGVMHRRTASRAISRLTVAVNKVETA